MEEFFPVLNIDGEVVGKATRKECHSGKMLLHPVVHLHVINPKGYLLLQKRSMNKDIQPGKWDTAVGGHVDYGETIETALKREVREELGLIDINPKKLTNYIFRSSIEQEMVNVFYIIVADDFSFNFNKDEIDDARFWSISEIEKSIGTGVLTPNFEQEFNRIKHLII